MSNLVNAEHVSISFGTRILLDDISLGLGRGDHKVADAFAPLIGG